MEGSFGREPVKCGGNLEATSTHCVLVKKSGQYYNSFIIYCGCYHYVNIFKPGPRTVIVLIKKIAKYCPRLEQAQCPWK